MTTQTTAPLPRRRVSAAVLRALLLLVWLLATLAVMASHFPGREGMAAAGALLSVAYIAVLIGWLARQPPAAPRLPPFAALMSRPARFRSMLGLILLALAGLFAVSTVLHPWLVLVVVSGAISVALMVAWRSRITRRMAGAALALGALVALGAWIRGEYDPFMLTYVATIPFMVVAGVLLLDRTALSVQPPLLTNARAALVSVATGCLLAVPPALLNLLNNTQQQDIWVTEWYLPFAALVPGIAEEAWARLFMTTLLYALLRPAAGDRPGRAIGAAILIGALTHAFAHVPVYALFGPAGVGMLVSGLLYGVPMGLLFVRRDFEHAVGYHFFIDFVRFFAAYWQM